MKVRQSFIPPHSTRFFLSLPLHVYVCLARRFIHSCLRPSSRCWVFFGFRISPPIPRHSNEYSWPKSYKHQKRRQLLAITQAVHIIPTKRHAKTKTFYIMSRAKHIRNYQRTAVHLVRGRAHVVMVRMIASLISERHSRPLSRSDMQ